MQARVHVFPDGFILVTCEWRGMGGEKQSSSMLFGSREEAIVWAGKVQDNLIGEAKTGRAARRGLHLLTGGGQ
jgi:hypothetical protein